MRNKKLPLLLSADFFPVTETNDHIWNQEPEYDTFNYAKVKFPLTSKSKCDLLEKNRKPFRCKSLSKYFSKYDNLKRLKTDSGKIESSLPSEFSSDPNYRDIANFPEVEYPLKASEIWKPNYWNSETDFLYRNVNANNYCIKPTQNEYFKPVKNFEKILEPKPPTLSTKSVGNSKKNPISLKKEKNYTNTTVNGIQKENKTISLNSSYVDNFHGNVSPISVSTCSPGNNLKNEFIYNVCPIDPKALEKETEKFFKYDIASNLTTQSELLVREYAKKFKDEMNSILKSVAEDIILNNFEFTNENIMPPAQMIKQEDILKSNSRNHDLNIYNEFASPDLLKNRRSQCFDEFTKNGKDSISSDINLKPKLTSVDNIINTNTDKFKKDMTSIIKSKAENYLAKATESSNDILKTNIKYNNLINEMDSLEPKKPQFIEDWQKTQSSIADVVVNRRIDKLNDDMTRKLRIKAENTFLKPRECSGQVAGQSLCADNNDKFYFNPKLSSADDLMCFNLNTINKEVPVLKPLSEKAINGFHHSAKLTDEVINTHVDNLYNEMTRKMSSKADTFLLKPYYDYCHGHTIGVQLSSSDDNNNHNYEPKLTHIENLTNLNTDSISTEMPVLKKVPENINKDFSCFTKLTDTSTNTYVDKLHHEETSKSHSRNGITRNESDNYKLTCHKKLNAFEELMSLNGKTEHDKNRTSNEVMPVLKFYDVTKTEDRYRTKLKDDSRKSNYINTQKKSNLQHKCRPTQSPQFSEISTKTNSNDDTSNLKQESNNEFSKTSITCENLLPNKNKTSDNEALLICVSDENDINNNNDKEDDFFLPANDIGETVVCSDSMDKEIEIEEDFTTDSYPEDDGSDWSSYALSTVAPRTSTVDTLWRDSSVIEPDKSISYPDELDQYFLMN